jgi:hypothetical protein
MVLGLEHARQALYHLSHALSPFSFKFSFQIGSCALVWDQPTSYLCLLHTLGYSTNAWPQTMILPIRLWGSFDYKYEPLHPA